MPTAWSPGPRGHPSKGVTRPVKILLWGGGALVAPSNSGGGVAERGSKGHKFIFSMEISENFGSNLPMGGGGRDVLEGLTTTGGPPPPLLE